LDRLSIAALDVFCVIRAGKYCLKTIFPVLTSLKLSGSRIKHENLKNLPDNLTELTLASKGEIVKGENSFGDLPRSILCLNLQITLEDEQEHGNELPPNLRKLRLSGLETHLDWFKKLPQSVTSLYIATSVAIRPSLLPVGLLKLRTSFPVAFSRSDLPALPQSLTNLRIHVDTGVDDMVMGLLPRNLTKLGCWGKISSLGLQQAPRNLTKLMVEVDPTEDPDIFGFFPPHSKMILLMASKKIWVNPLPLPPKLVHLSLGRISDEICLSLPPQLEFLHVSDGTITAKGASKFLQLAHLREVCFTIETLSDEVIPWLSNITLVRLLPGPSKNENKALSYNFVSLLHPPVVTHDSIDNHTLLPNEHALPVSNEKSTGKIEHLQFMFSGWSQTHSYLSESMFRSFQSLSSLLRLQINSSRSNLIPVDCLSFLPSQLVFLSINHLDRFPDPKKHLDNLPKNLHTLIFNAVESSCPWVDSDLIHLPRKLQVLFMNGKLSHLTQNLNRYTPPYLVQFVSNGGGAELFKGPLANLTE
jgi:hypothetical protein